VTVATWWVGSVVIICELVIAYAHHGTTVHPLFASSSVLETPFPSDQFTVEDISQNTGRRVQLPLPDCSTRPSDCVDASILNSLDGFNLQPRISIPFDGPIDVSTVTSTTVFLIRLNDPPVGRKDDDGGRVVGINQIVWDALTNTLHVQSDALLEQHTRYALIVTCDVRDSTGASIGASEAFRAFRSGMERDYKLELLDALFAARRAGLQEKDIAVASVFTTQSATAFLEQVRDQIKSADPGGVDFLLGPGGIRTVFSRNNVTTIAFNRQIVIGGGLSSVNVPLAWLDTVPGVVGTIAFGAFESPDYQVHPGEYIPTVATRSGVPAVQATNDIYFSLFLPSGPKPSEGWPVAIFGHGGGSTKNIELLKVVSKMAEKGIATIGINSTGHGFGPLGTLTVTYGGGTVTFPAGGRGRDQDGNGLIDSQEGMSAAAPLNIIGFRDGFRQTAIDLMQLTRLIEAGVDVDDDSAPDLDASRIYYFGQSQGANFGTLLMAVEPDIRTGVLTVPGSPVIDSFRLSPSRRAALGAQFSARLPSLLNAPGVTTMEGITVPSLHFHDNTPLRDGLPLSVVLADGTNITIQSPVRNEVDGAMAIQKFLDNAGWIFQLGSAPAFAPHLRRSPLPGVSAKSVIIQYGMSDMTIPNPLETAVVRAGDLADRTIFYRHDVAFAENTARPKTSHTFMISIDVPSMKAISLSVQEQIAVFFASDGESLIQPEPVNYFEVPIRLPLPESLNYIP
jgi:Bacterial virulence factor lipase N-terminal